MSNAGSGNVSGEATHGKVQLFDPSGSGRWRAFLANVSYFTNAVDGRDTNQIGGGLIANTNAIDGIQFYFSSGNITSGTFKLYGIK